MEGTVLPHRKANSIMDKIIMSHVEYCRIKVFEKFKKEKQNGVLNENRVLKVK